MNNDSVEKFAKVFPIEKAAKVLEKVGLSPEQLTSELSKLEGDIAGGPGEIEKQGKTLLTSGLNSTKSKEPGLLEKGAGILSIFKKSRGARREIQQIKIFVDASCCNGNLGRETADSVDPGTKE